MALLHQFDPQVLTGEAFPRRDEVTPNLGIMEPMKGDDLTVRVNIRGKGAV